MAAVWAAAGLAPLITVLALALVGLQPSDPAGDRARARIAWVAPWTTLPALVLALAGPAAGSVELPDLVLGTTLEVDGVARLLLLVVVLIYLPALWTTAARRTHHSPLLSAILLLCFLGNAGALLAADAVTFYLFFALMSFAAYGLVVHRGTTAARRAARVYLVLTVVSEVLVLAGLMFVVTGGGRVLTEAPAAVAASPHATLIVVLLMVGFGIKAGTVPLHVWVAPAYRQAPAPGAAVLSGALSKVGLVGMLRFLPLGEAGMAGVGWAIVGAGLAGMFGSIIAGVLRRDGRTALAYSSVGQLGLLALLVGAALVDPALAPACIAAAVLYIAHHGLAKAALFLGAPLWAGRAVVRRWVAAGSGLAALSIAGAPLTPGFLAKYGAKEAVGDLPLLASALTVLGVGSTLILARALWLLHRDPPGAELPAQDAPGALATAPDHPPHASRAAILAWAVLALAAVLVPWVAGTAWVSQAHVPELSVADLWAATWPVLLGLLAAGGALWFARRGARAFRSPPTVPAGDLLVPAAALGRVAVAAASAGGATVGRGYRRARDGLTAVAERISPTAAAARGEAVLGTWRASGLALLLVAALVVAAGWVS